MKILYLGDIVGENTIAVLKNILEAIKREYGINIVLANAENVTGGLGLSEKHYKELCALRKKEPILKISQNIDEQGKIQTIWYCAL